MPLNAGTLLGAIAAVVASLSSQTVQATERGGSTYPFGIENYYTGAAPPPGTYLLAYGQYYTADRIRDNVGNDVPLPPDFKVRIGVVALRGVWVTPATVLGGNPVLQVIVPLVDLSLTAGGTTDRKQQVGDLVVGTGLAFHHSPSLHSAVGLDITLPTASWSATERANVGHNIVSWQPIYALSLIEPAGPNVSFKALGTINQTNRDIRYRSGSEVIVDYAAGWGLGNGFVVGIGGYVRRQIDDDRVDGADLVGNRARAFAIGPSVAFNNGKGWLVTAKWQAETGVRNTTQGSAFWVKTTVPF